MLNFPSSPSPSVGDIYTYGVRSWVWSGAVWSAAPSAGPVDGSDGVDGREVEFQKSATHIQWRYVGGATWTNLVALGDLKGVDGNDGTDGHDGAAGVDGSDGVDGREVEFQKSATHIQWRYVGDLTWADLIALDDLKGADGNDGAAGVDGNDGAAGADALWNFTGAYNPGLPYAVGDVATYNGETWYRVNSNGGNVGDTPSEGAFWTRIAQKGLDGSDRTIISPTAPTNPVPGMRWIHEDQGRAYEYLDDTWVELGGGGGGTSGPVSYNALTDLPTLGTAAVTASTDYATAAQGTTADSALQPDDLTPYRTSSDQDTIDAGKAASSHTHPLSQLQQSSATNGQVPTWNATTSAWVPQTPASGGNFVVNGGGVASIQMVSSEPNSPTAGTFYAVVPASGVNSELWLGADRIFPAAPSIPDWRNVGPTHWSSYQYWTRRTTKTASVANTVFTPSVNFNGFIGGVLMTDGRVFCIPHTATSAAIYNPNTDTISTVPFWSNAYFSGGVLLRDGRVFCIPSFGGTARIYNPADATIIDVNGFPGGNHISGGVVLPDGRVFCAPNTGTTARIYDPATNTITTPNGTYPTGQAFSNAVLLPDGRVFCVPYNGTTARIYDPVTDTVTTPNGAYPGSRAYSGGVVLPDGRVVCGLAGTVRVRIYDPVTDTLTTSNVDIGGSDAFFGAVLLPNGNVFCVPRMRSAAAIYNPVTDQVSYTPDLGTIHNAFFGGVLLLDGRVFCVPKTNATARIYGGGQAFNQNIALSTYHNKI
jgi:hypothetical protein